MEVAKTECIMSTCSMLATNLTKSQSRDGIYIMSNISSNIYVNRQSI